MKIFNLKNSTISISLQEKCITSIIFDNEELIHSKIPFFLVKLRERNAETKLVSAFDFDFVKEDSEGIHYTHPSLDVILNIKEDESIRLIWNIKVINKTDKLIEQVELMSLGLYPKLLDEENGKGEVIIPYNEGARVTNLARRNKSPFPYMDVEYPSLGKYFVFPNMLCSQFVGYICNNKGLYFGMHDETRTTKHLDFNYVNNSLKIQLRTFANVNYGEDYEMDFDCVLELFNGDYFDCFEIYRKWFYSHLPSGVTKIKDNKLLPSWYHESPIVITYPVKGLNDGDTKMLDNPNLYPYKNALPALKEFAEKTNSKVMTLLMHWEGTAPWAPPYSWPPYGGEEMFSDFLNECHKVNILVGLYTSGFGYTLESYRGNYNKFDEYQNNNLSSIMCINSNGYMKSTVVDNIRLGYDLCPKCDESKKLIIQESEKLLSSGVDYVQVLDQNHGGCSYFCYSDNHGHIPAPGKWQVEETNKILSSIDKKNALLGCESGAAEPFLKYLLFSDNRFILNYYIGMPIPMYGYIYHEFVNNFMGNQICMSLDYNEHSYLYRLAYAFKCGDMFTYVLDNSYDIMDAWCLSKAVNKDTVLRFTNTLNACRREFSEYLHLGKMQKPLEYKCSKEYFKQEDGTILNDKAVLTTCFEYENKTVQFLINYTLNEQEVEFEEAQYFINEGIKSKKVTLKPMSVTYFER